MTPETDETFAAAYSPDTISEAIADPDILTGRREGGLVTDIGLFGGHGATTDAEAVTCSEDNVSHTGIQLVQQTYKAIDSTEFDGRIRFPCTLLKKPMYGRSSRDCPFTEYKFPFYIAPGEDGYMDSESTLFDGVTETLQRWVDDGDITIDAIEFTRGEHTLGEQFRTVYPWVKHVNNLSDEDNEFSVELPTPIRSAINTLRDHPELPEYYVVTVSVHRYSSHYDRYDSVDDVFKDSFFSGVSAHRHVFAENQRTETDRHLDAAGVQVERETHSYTVTFTVDSETVEYAIETDASPFYGVTDTATYGRWLARGHCVETYGCDDRDVSVGIESIEETDTESEVNISVVVTV